MRAGRNHSHGHRLGRRLDRQHGRNRHVQLLDPERLQNGTESAQPENRMERALPNRSVPVAQRTGAKRFLAPAAKTASAGVTLALAVAALLLAGCGGGSSEGASSGSTSSTSSSSK